MKEGREEGRKEGRKEDEGRKIKERKKIKERRKGDGKHHFQLRIFHHFKTSPRSFSGSLGQNPIRIGKDDRKSHGESGKTI